MVGGESTSEKVRWRIQEFLFRNGPSRATDIITDCEASEATGYKYLDELCKEGKVIWRPKRKRGKSTYELSEETKNEIERLLLQGEVSARAASLDAKWLPLLRNFLIKVKREASEPEEFLNNNCLTFIGDVPIAFTKSVEAMQSHLAFRDNLYKRHTRDLERFREDFIRAHMKADKKGRAHVEAKIRDEVGWTIGEYLRKLLKKAEKEKGVRKIMTVLGITEEMLEEMYKQQAMHAKQERLFRTFLSTEKEKG